MVDNTAALAQAMHLLRAGQLAEAEQQFRKILTLDKDNSRARFALGIVCYQLGRLSEAERHLSAAISGSPDFLPAYNNLALVYKAMGDVARGMATLRRVLSIAPGYVDAIYNLALMLAETGATAPALQSYRRVIELKPDFLRAHTNLGLLLRAGGDAAAAVVHLDFAVAQQPQDDTASVNLALVLTDLARYAEAIDAATRATQLAPKNFSAWEALGNAQRLGGDASGAIASLQRAHALQPASVEVQYELGLAQSAVGDLAAARGTFDVVARLRPDWLKVSFARDLALPPFYASAQHIADSNAAWVAGIENIEARLKDVARWSVQEGVAAISGYAPFYLHYQGLDNTNLQRRFGRIVETVARRAWPQFAAPVAWQPLAHGGRVRVGFVSAYLRRHSVGNFFGNWICQLDAGKFESFVWHTGEARDDSTEKIRARAAHFSHTAFDVGALSRAIHASRLDVLIYLDVGMHPHAQVLAALHLAPVQCATFGHPVTTGLDSIGHFLSADAAEPANAKQHYSENLIRLPRIAVSYARADVSRRLMPSAQSTAQRPLVFCAQPLFKILPAFDLVLARIAHEMPGCRLAFIASLWSGVNDAFVSRIGAVLRAAGVDPSQTLQMLPIMPYEQYLGALAAADAVLDTTGFSGGNSSFDAIAVNAPLVSHRGTMLRGRQTAAMLDIIGLPELARTSDDDYVSSAIGLASNKNRQREVREQMASGSAALFDDDGAVVALERELMRLVT